LDTNVDSIRLLTILNADGPEKPIKCTLEHVTFAERAKYEALSYTWGEAIAKKKVSINGKDFEVGKNLYDALRHIRKYNKDRVIWVDAICINQSDLIEKNSQIRMMTFTYSRATQVLIWLGIPMGIDKAYLPSLPQVTVKAQDHLADSTLSNLCRNPYWRRVWIIQEIGKARRLYVFIGAFNVRWEHFMERVAMSPKCKDTHPMEIRRQLDDKYRSGHKLQQLIERHQSSLCKEPRDHHDLLKFGELVQRMLGGPRIATRDMLQLEAALHDTAVEQVWDEEYRLIHREVNVPEKADNTQNQLMIPTRIAGRIAHLGPTFRAIVADTSKISEWNSVITRWIPETQLPKAREEFDLFIELLDSITDGDLQLVKTYDRTVAWELPTLPQSLEIRENAPPNYMPSHEAAPAVIEPRLFLLSGTREEELTSSGKMGLVPPEAEEGDYICQVQGISKALIVRKHVGVRIIGTAVMAENNFLARERRDMPQKSRNSAQVYSRFGIAQFEKIHMEDRLDVFVDVATAYGLLQ
ncbi:heterokaryon incompatibility protein-domain-containing protein, partial [Calycina marina]